MAVWHWAFLEAIHACITHASHVIASEVGRTAWIKKYVIRIATVQRVKLFVHFLLIFGPPAVGKMAVGQAIEAATGIRLFHNHLSIEPVLHFFPFGSPSFSRLVTGFRRHLFAEVARSDLPGLAFTFVWDLTNAEDLAFVAESCRTFEDAGAEVALVELKASLTRRLARNRTEERLREKPSKRDLDRSEQDLLRLEHSGRQLNSAGPLPLPYQHVVVDNTDLSVMAAANVIISELGLPRLGA